MKNKNFICKKITTKYKKNIVKVYKMCYNFNCKEVGNERHNYF